MAGGPPGLDPDLRAAAIAARGFMPTEEGDALQDAGIDAAGAVPDAPFLEIGSYCGKSSIWLGGAARVQSYFGWSHRRDIPCTRK